MGGVPVNPETYDSTYFLKDCGGIEFYELSSKYGTEILKPYLALELRKFPISPGTTVADLGCGRGEFLPALARKGARVFGFDYSEEAVKISRENVQKMPEEERSRIVVQKADVKNLPLEDAQADVIFFNDIFEHLRDWEVKHALREIRRVLKPDGLLVVHTGPNRLYYKFWLHPILSALASLASRIGLALKPPRNPWSEWDRKVHVNEQNCFSLKRSLTQAGFSAEVELLPNMKYMCAEIYGADLPDSFPINPARGPMAWIFMKVLYRWPLKIWLARDLIAVARPKSTKSHIS